jgi:hypothetical protein
MILFSPGDRFERDPDPHRLSSTGRAEVVGRRHVHAVHAGTRIPCQS